MRTFDFRHAVSVDDAIRSVAETGGAISQVAPTSSIS